MSMFSKDVRYGVRRLLGSPGFSLAAIATLTLTIGASTAAFSVVRGVLLAPLPFDAPERLVHVGRTRPGSDRVSGFSNPDDLENLRDASRTLAGLAGSASNRANLDEAGPPELVRFQMVTAGYFDVLGVRPVLGRFFVSEDRLPDGTRPAVISYGYWRTKWSGATGVLGQPLRAFGNDTTLPRVVGVVPEMRYTMRGGTSAAFYVPYTTDLVSSPGSAGITTNFVVRTTPGATVPLEQAILRVEPDAVVSVHPMGRLIRDTLEREQFQTAVLGSFAAAALVLAMLGIYSVVAFSTAQRTREIGLRMALGAASRDVVVQMMRHGFGPAALGLGLGLLAARGLTRYLESYLFEIEPADSAVYLVAVAGGLLLIAVASWIPARTAARCDPISALRHE